MQSYLFLEGCMHQLAYADSDSVIYAKTLKFHRPY